MSLVILATSFRGISAQLGPSTKAFLTEGELVELLVNSNQGETDKDGVDGWLGSRGDRGVANNQNFVEGKVDTITLPVAEDELGGVEFAMFAEVTLTVGETSTGLLEKVAATCA